MKKKDEEMSDNDQKGPKKKRKTVKAEHFFDFKDEETDEDGSSP
jgi:hypothetical protein